MTGGPRAGMLAGKWVDVGDLKEFGETTRLEDESHGANTASHTAKRMDGPRLHESA